jgi:hypothetical protein
VSSTSTYRAFFIGCTGLLGAKELRSTRAPPKVKLFFWLVLHGRLWTADRWKRHGLQDDDACALCNQRPKIVPHFLSECMMTRDIWFQVAHSVGLEQLVVELGPGDPIEWWLRRRIQVGFEHC